MSMGEDANEIGIPRLRKSELQEEVSKGDAMSALDCTDAEIERAARLQMVFKKTVLDNPFIPQKPTPKQAAFLMQSDTREVLYGGAAGGAKSSGMLMAAAQFVETPGYNAILFRNTEGELTQADGLVPRALTWWKGFGDKIVKWNGNDFVWTWQKSGATIRFQYMERDEHALDHRGGAYQFIGFDEASLHTSFQMTYLFRSLRKPSEGPLSEVPLRMRLSSNPGGKGSGFLRERFVPDAYMDEPDEDVRFSKMWWKADPTDGTRRLFVPARLKDNPHLNYEEYVQSLMQLDPVTRAQQLHGDWREFSGGRFQKEWFARRWWRHGDYFYTTGTMDRPNNWHKSQLHIFVVVDSAISEKSKSDFTAAGAFAACPDGDLLVLKVKRARMFPQKVCEEVLLLCQETGATKVGFESDNYQRLLADMARKTPGMPPVVPLYTRNVGKLHRGLPAITQAEGGRIVFPQTPQPWMGVVLTELLAFSGDPKKDLHDDVFDMIVWATMMQKTAGPKFGQPAPQVEVPETRRLADRRHDKDRHTERGLYGRGGS